MAQLTEHEKQILVRLAAALHLSDVEQGHGVASLEEIGEAGRESYLNDALALLRVLSGVGLCIGLSGSNNE